MPDEIEELVDSATLVMVAESGDPPIPQLPTGCEEWSAEWGGGVKISEKWWKHTFNLRPPPLPAPVLHPPQPR